MTNARCAMAWRRVAVLVLMLLLPMSVLRAKSKEKVFNADSQKLFDAAVRVASSNHKVLEVDKENRRFSFQTGTSMASRGFNCRAKVEAVSESSSKLTLDVEKRHGQMFAWGAGDRMAEKFFRAVEEELR